MNPATGLPGQFRQGTSFVLYLAAALLAESFLFLPTAHAATTDPLEVWYTRPFVATDQLRTVIYAGGKFVAGGSEVLTSLDGATWSRHSLPADGYIMGFAYGNDVFTAVTVEGGVFKSPDGVNWTERPLPTRGELWSIAYGNGVFVAVGSYIARGVGYKPSTLTSPDGLEWVRHDIDGPGSPLLSVAFGDGTFVATGAFGAIYTSTNGAQWTLRPSPFPWSLHGLTYGKGTFVITSGNMALISTNRGESWMTNAIARPESSFNEAGYAEGTFVAVGFAGDRVATSPDGVHWTARLSGSADTFLGVAYGGARFVIVGNKVLQSSPLEPVPPLIFQQPQSLILRAGNTYSNMVVAEMLSPLTYQWRKDGVDLTGATGATLVIANAPLSLSGGHTVVVTGVGGATTSVVANVLVAEPVGIALQPVSQSVVQGGAAVFSVEATGTLPISFRWRRNSSTTQNVVADTKVSFLTVTNVQAAADYTVVVGNIVSNPGVLSDSARLTVLPDSDGDGLPDGFESAHGLDPANPADAALDSDGDGISNAAEYRAGTDPANSGSYLKVDRISVSGGARVEFLSQAGKTYEVEYADSIAHGVWRRLSQIAARPTSRTEVVIDPTPEPVRFYRLVTPAGL